MGILKPTNNVNIIVVLPAILGKLALSGDMVVCIRHGPQIKLGIFALSWIVMANLINVIW